MVDEGQGTWRFKPGDEVFGMPLFPADAHWLLDGGHLQGQLVLTV